jgi:hypothetical protein
MVAQNRRVAEGGLQAGGIEGTHGNGDRTSGAHLHFKIYQSQVPVIDRLSRPRPRMLGSDKSRGYCLKMICADFLARAHLDNGNPDILLNSISRYYKFLPREQQQVFLETLREKAS